MNTMRFIMATGCLFCLLSVRGADQDSMSIRSNAVYDNPAARYFEHSRPTSEAVLRGTFSRSQERYILQEGKGRNAWEAEARSWIPAGKNMRIWGKAAYRNGVRKSVSWNETSDFDLLYPYVMADSVGGDLNSQRYAFHGGYAGISDRFNWGVQLDYRAEIESRDIDPRPRNVVSDLRFSLGGTYRLFRKYRLGVSAALRKYDQNNDLDFYSSLGNAFVHTMTGLGNTYTRFTGNRTSADYVGTGYKAALQLFSEQEMGWRATAAFNRFFTTRKLTSEDNIPLTEMKDQRLEITVGYLHDLEKCRIGLGATAEIVDRNGTENLFDSGNGSSFEKIGNRQPYSDRQEHWQIEAFYEPALSGKLSLRLKPFYGSSHVKTTYSDNNRRMEFTRNSLGMDVEIRSSIRKSQWKLRTGGAYQPTSNNSLLLEGLAEGAMKEMYNHNFRTLTTCRSVGYAQLRALFPYNGQVDIYGEAMWQTEVYGNSLGNNHKIAISLGVCF